MNSQGISQDGICHKCQSRGQVLSLSCGHCFCLKCSTYTYLKYKQSMGRPTLSRCILCQVTIDHTDPQLKAIRNFTDQYLVPLLREEATQKQHRTPVDASSLTKQFKSHEHSIQKLTPIGRGFYSKCESPKSGMFLTTCSTHPDQEITAVCLTCQNCLLCMSCTSTKKHNNHILKTLNKGFEAVQQKAIIAKLKNKQHIDALQILRKKIDDRKSLIKQRKEKATLSLRYHFGNLIDLVNRKSEQIINTCSFAYQKLLEDLSRNMVRVEDSLRNARIQLDRLTDVVRPNVSTPQAIRTATNLIQQVQQYEHPYIQQLQTLDCFEWQCTVKQVQKICVYVQKIVPYQSRRMCSASRSQQKLLKQNYFKRLKTNMASPNSSRQKKQRKATKTEQDQKRNKSRANYKTQSSGKIKQSNKILPTYLLQHLQKHNILHADPNPLTSSFKSSSKLLSKTNIVGQDYKRKKQHTALVKQRLQRKTFNGQVKDSRPGTDMKKKKMPN